MSDIRTIGRTASVAAVSEARDPARLRIVIADDHRLFREGLHALLDAENDCHVIGEACDGREALRLTHELAPDILLLDYAMPWMTGLDVLRELAGMAGAPRVILLTADIDKHDVVRALQLGARGLILKESASTDLMQAIRAVSGGKCWVRPDTMSDVLGELRGTQPGRSRSPSKDFGLTERELDVVAAVVVDAYGNKDIASKLAISEKTVKHHLTNIFDKLGVSNRLELARFAVHHHLDLPDLSD